MPRREKQRDKKRRRGESPEEEMLRETRAREQMLEAWVPKTGLGKMVKNGEIVSLEEIFEKGFTILEPQIVDFLVKDLETQTMDLKKTARVVSAGRQFSYRATVLIGNRNGIVGVGIASDRERMAAVQKASAQARLNVIPVYRGCGSWECNCGTGHSLPFQVLGRCGSVKVRIKPAPKGIGLVTGEHVKEVFRFAGVRDVWTETTGHTATTLNFVKATINALSKTNRMKVSASIHRKLTGMHREG
jgi:small subunit ribosomal protein S5